LNCQREKAVTDISSVLDPKILPPYVVIDLYGRRWKVEEAFLVVKRLLAYLIFGPVREWN
jgi:IS4 transposase